MRWSCSSFASMSASFDSARFRTPVHEAPRRTRSDRRSAISSSVKPTAFAARMKRTRSTIAGAYCR